jgi:hypothetical protein
MIRLPDEISTVNLMQTVIEIYVSSVERTIFVPIKYEDECFYAKKTVEFIRIV